jgi:hypothetical protein
MNVWRLLGSRFAVRGRGKPIARDEEAPASQAPVAHHQILDALRCPPPVTLGRDSLPREPLRYLAVVVADLSNGRLDVGLIDDGIVVSELDHS